MNSFMWVLYSVKIETGAGGRSGQLLLSGQFPGTTTSRDQDFYLRSRNVLTSLKIRSKVSGP